MLNNPVNATDPTGHANCAAMDVSSGPCTTGGGGGVGPKPPPPAVAQAAGDAVQIVVGAALIAHDVQQIAQIVQDGGAADAGQASGQTGTEKTNPYTGPVDKSVTVVDPHGNAIPVKKGEHLTGSPDGRYVQVRDTQGKPTGTRIDGPHKPQSHPDPRAQQPHAHVPGKTNPDGTRWLPVKGPR